MSWWFPLSAYEVPEQQRGLLSDGRPLEKRRIVKRPPVDIIESRFGLISCCPLKHLYYHAPSARVSNLWNSIAKHAQPARDRGGLLFCQRVFLRLDQAFDAAAGQFK